MRTNTFIVRYAAVVLSIILSPRAEAACPKLIHFTTQTGVYAPGDMMQINFVLSCPGPERCGPCVLTFFIGSGCGAQIGFIAVEQIEPGVDVDIHATMIVPQNAPDGTYHVCLRAACKDECDWTCVGCQDCDCTEELITVDSPRIGDVNGDGAINVDDLIAVILAWGPCAEPCPPTCAADVNDDCAVNVDDLIAVILNWG
jgi:hypothetical protein